MAASAWAAIAAGLAALMVPVTSPGPSVRVPGPTNGLFAETLKPVIAVPGLTPRSPPTMVAPVLVTVEAPRTAKVLAAPRLPAPVPKSGSGGGGGKGGKQGADAHTAETLLASIVTAPLSAKVLPNTLAPVFRVMLASARIFPENSVFAPRVAELPTAHHTLVAVAPPTMTTLAPAPVMKAAPLLVTVEAPRTAKLPAVSRFGAVCAHAAWKVAAERNETTTMSRAVSRRRVVARTIQGSSQGFV